MNRTPMSRGTGFKKLARLRIPPSPPRPIERGVVASCAGMGVAVPKTVAQRNPHLLAMANGKPCLLQIPGVCNFDPKTTVACHSNQSVHEKGGHRKADDCFSCWGCSACHWWLDFGPAVQPVKTAAFERGLFLQMGWWARIVADLSYSPKDRKAAHWALLMLESKESAGQ